MQFFFDDRPEQRSGLPSSAAAVPMRRQACTLDFARILRFRRGKSLAMEMAARMFVRCLLLWLAQIGGRTSWCDQRPGNWNLVNLVTLGVAPRYNIYLSVLSPLCYLVRKRRVGGASEYGVNDRRRSTAISSCFVGLANTSRRLWTRQSKVQLLVVARV